MTNDQIYQSVQNLLINHFDIPLEAFKLDQPLESLHNDFQYLGTLLELERLINEHFAVAISLIDNIDTSKNGLKDIVILLETC